MLPCPPRHGRARLPATACGLTEYAEGSRRSSHMGPHSSSEVRFGRAGLPLPGHRRPLEAAEPLWSAETRGPGDQGTWVLKSSTNRASGHGKQRTQAPRSSHARQCGQFWKAGLNEAPVLPGAHGERGSTEDGTCRRRPPRALSKVPTRASPPQPRAARPPTAQPAPHAAWTRSR